MHALGPFAAIFLLCFTITAYPITEVVYQMDTPKKCCMIGYAFNEHFECVHVEPDRYNYITHNARQTIASQHPQQINTVIASVQGLICRDYIDLNHFPSSYAVMHAPKNYCVENIINGTMVRAMCPKTGQQSETPDMDDSAETTLLTRTTTTTMRIITTKIITTIITTIDVTNATSNSSREDTRKTVRHSLSAVFFWGAQTYMNTNLTHLILCIVVVVVYLSVPELGKSIHNRAVLRHNVCLMLLGCILMYLGYCDLCDCLIGDNFAVFLWIMLQYFTNATVFWLNVICFDMTLSITRFRWMVGSGQRTNQEENKRLLVYGIFAWGGALIPAIVACILEFCPGIPMDFPLKPNYSRYRGGPNPVVNIYFFCIPLLTLFLNNVLFVFTTYRIIRIQRSTEIATKNQTNALRKKYFLFLQMYLLMGAPWFFGLLFACLNKLVVLKICRMIWPILWLLMLATQKKLREKFISKLRCVTKEEATAIGE